MSEASALENEGKIPVGSGYQYIDPVSCDEMVKYHVNAYAHFQERMKQEKFGGRLSVHKPSNSKALISFGHDECIFKQFTFSAKSWHGPNGEIVVILKDDGLGIMISAFHSLVNLDLGLI